MLEITHLPGNLSDLTGVVNLSAIWAGNGPEQIVDALLKVLIFRLDLQFAAARLSGNSPMSATEMLRTAPFEDGEQGASTFPSQISTWWKLTSNLHRTGTSPRPRDSARCNRRRCSAAAGSFSG